MSRLSRADTERVRGIARELDVFRTGQPSALATMLPAVREASGLPRIIAYDVRLGEDGFELGNVHHDGVHRSSGTVAEGLASYVASSRRRIGYFNPLRPEPRQRNRVVALPMSLALAPARAPATLGLSSRELAEVEGNLDSILKMFATFGVDSEHQLRTLVCHGETMLCFLGGYQPEPFSHRQKAVFNALVGPLRRRLIREERFRNCPGTEAALDAALEHIAGAALVVSASGRVRHANSAGRRLCRGARLAPGLLDELRAPQRFDVTRLSEPGVPDSCLMVERPRSPELAVRVARAARRLELTPRETEILSLIAQGEGNRAISAQLSCAERTVEVHVTHMLEKADVESRAALIAQVWSGN